MIDAVIALDVSPSMGRPSEGLKPSKLAVARDAVAYAASRLLEASPRARLGLLLFYRHAYPLLPPTSDRGLIAKALALVRVLGPGTAPGEAVVEAVKMLRGSRRRRRVVIVTDGGFNEGVRLDYTAYYAAASGVEVDIATLGEEPPKRDRELIVATAKRTGGRWLHAPSRDEAYRALAELLLPGLEGPR